MSQLLRGLRKWRRRFLAALGEHNPAMATIGYHCSHEQFSPGELLGHVQLADRAGFRAAVCSDHFHPWLGAAIQGTTLPFGTVNAPGQRYHPAIIAQAADTVAGMFPGRFWVALGTGQLLNEHLTGDPWPAKEERRVRLPEYVSVMRALWAGETVTHDGLVRVREAQLHSLPVEPPAVVGAADSKETAGWVGSWADALITVYKPADEQAEVIEAIRRGGGGEGKPMYLQAQLSYASTDEEARAAAQLQRRQAALESTVLTEIPNPADFARRSRDIDPGDLDECIRLSADLSRHAAWIEEYFAMGFEAVYLHHVGRDQARFIDAFGEHVLPSLVEWGR